MKKGIFIFLLLLVAIIGIAPFGIGIMLEKQNQTLLNNYKLNTSMQAVDISYKRGWFHSQAVSTFTIQSNTAQPTQFTLHQQLRHGPILWGNEQPLALGFADLQSSIEFSNNFQSKIKDIIGDMPDIQLLGKIHYDGHTDGEMIIPAFTHNNPEKHTHIDFQTLTLKASGNLDMQESKGHLYWKGMSVTSPQAKAWIGENTSQFNMQQQSNVWTGNMSWQSKQIEMTSPQKNIRIEGMNITATTLMDEQHRVSSQQVLHMDSFTHNESIFTEGNLDIAIRHIPASTLEKLNAMQKKALQERNQYTVGMDMLSLLPEIIAAEPVIEINDASLQTPNGEVKSHLRIAIIGLKKNDIFNIPKVKRHIQADIFVRFPMALVHENNRSQIMDYIQKGWLIQQGHMLEGKLHMADGVLTINQQTIALPF